MGTLGVSIGRIKKLTRRSACHALSRLLTVHFILILFFLNNMVGLARISSAVAARVVQDPPGSVNCGDDGFTGGGNDTYKVEVWRQVKHWDN